MDAVREILWTLFIWILAPVMAVALAGCEEKKVYRIGVSQCSRDDWRAKMNEEIMREMIFHSDAEVEIRSADDSNDKQIADIRYFADNGFDIIVAAPNEADALTPVISEVYGRGIPVLLFDRGINGDTYTAYQGADNKSIGRSAARLATSLVPSRCRVIEISGLAGSTPAADRAEGFAAVAGEDADLTVVASAPGNWNASRGAAVADSMLGAHPEANLIYAHNDRMAIAAAEVARRRGRDDIKIIGIDAAPEIGIKAVADSVIDATFLYPTEGYRLIRTAMAIVKGEPYERHVLLPEASVVDLSNAGILLLQNEELKDETDKINWLKARVDEYWSRHSVQTTLFYAAIAIVVLLFLLIFGMLRAFWSRRQSQERLAGQNRMLAEQRDRLSELNGQLKEATQSKLMFYTNVSHDLRTPLTLIAGPVEQLVTAPNLTPDQQSLMRLANKNVSILKRLINQILDFRKYENGRLELTLTEIDMIHLLADWCDSFVEIARRREIDFTVAVPGGTSFSMAIDVEKIQRVMFNLISNAFKYTPRGGSISVAFGLEDNMVAISVADTGKGIGADDLSHIFERFFQVDKVHPNGSGIGLSLAKAFVELHGGSITVESEEGKGSVFKVMLPIRHVAPVAAPVDTAVSPADISLELGEVASGAPVVDKDRTAVLIIDDNPDIRAYVASVLKDEYAVLTAPDGAAGVDMATEYVPDLVICDVMMPVMDGLECCRRLKGGRATSHIPVLMLTACTMDEQRIQGYECGADGYLSKPFNSRVLMARCKSLIENRRRIKAPAALPDPESRPAPAEEVTAQVGEIDSEFYRRFVATVEESMADSELTVDAIAQRLGLGRTQFYRKIKALTGYSPVELLRNMRLDKARELLATTERSVSEIAYAVGFSTPAYFGKCYKDRYGATPTELREHRAAAVC